MKSVALGVALAAIVSVMPSAIVTTPAPASELSSRERVFAYCLRGGPEGGTRCRYTSRQQCVKSSSGRGGSCVRNPELQQRG
jgi:Protein of unknown function (DUF3551)